MEQEPSEDREASFRGSGKVCRGLWAFIQANLYFSQEISRDADASLIWELTLGIAITVFRQALSKELIRHMIRHFHAWPEPWHSLTFDILIGRVSDPYNYRDGPGL